MSGHPGIAGADHTGSPMNAPTRPALRWFGGKWKLAPWILAHFPQHRTYVEPFGGAASVLLRKPRSYAEVYNDLDDWVVNLFRVLRDEALAPRLIAQLRLTPFARSEFDAVREIGEAIGAPVELARRLIIRSFMGFGANAHNGRSTGFRANTSRSGTTPAEDWANYPGALPALIERLRGVIIEHRDAIAVMAAHDGAATLHYVDPPYMAETRSPGNRYDLKYRRYRHEMDDAGHGRLIDELRRLTGCVALSGYACPLYDERLSDWHRVETAAHADGARPRTEVLWLNPVCWQRLQAERGADLFSSLSQIEAAGQPAARGPRLFETAQAQARGLNRWV
jgi:DNA adenine methylase